MTANLHDNGENTATLDATVVPGSSGRPKAGAPAGHDDNDDDSGGSTTSGDSEDSENTIASAESPGTPRAATPFVNHENEQPDEDVGDSLIQSRTFIILTR
jgi:hypothetical protein